MRGKVCIRVEVSSAVQRMLAERADDSEGLTSGYVEETMVMTSISAVDSAPAYHRGCICLRDCCRVLGDLRIPELLRSRP